MAQDDVFNVLVASDTHLGIYERDPVRGTDSFAAFEEILIQAQERDADLVLLAGDLFHDNKPSRRTMFKTLELLRRYALGDKPIRFQVISDQAANFHVTGRVNYEDPAVAVALPIFSIHGNHDDPTREGGVEALAALDLLAAANLVNYVGRSEHADKVEVSPVLLKKGDTRLAIYGLGNMRDERLNRLWQQKKVSFLRPTAADDGEEPYFSIFVLHQNRDVGRGKNTCVHESMIPEWFDLVIWGHEHESLIKPRESAVGTFRITQPGSPVATSLVEGEARPKHCGLLQIRGDEFRLNPHRLSNVRPFAHGEIALADEDGLGDEDDREQQQNVSQVLADKVESLIEEAKAGALEPATEGMTQPMALPDQVLVRLRVDHTGFGTVNNAKFGSQFVGRVANADSILHFQKQKVQREKQPAFEAAPVEEGELDAVRIEDLVQDQLEKAGESAKLNIMKEEEMNEALDTFVAKSDATAFAELVDKTLSRTQKDLAKSGATGARPEGVDVALDDDEPAKAKKPSSPRAGGKAAPKRGRKDSSDEEEEDDDEPPPKRAPARRPAARKKAPPPESDEDDDDEEPPPKKPAPRASRAKAAKKPEVVDLASDDEEEESEEELPPPPKKARAPPKAAPKAAARKPPGGAKKKAAKEVIDVDMDGWSD